ncbi:MAG: glycosyltransferase family 39 protein [Myxococcota bacterium]
MAALLRFRLLSVPFERDEGEYAYAGQLILQGIVPYDLAYTMKLPGVSGIYAMMMLVLGQTHESIHLGLLIVNAITIVLVFALGKKLIGPLAGVAGAAFFAVASTLSSVQGLWANTEHFVLPFALAGILTYLRWLSDQRNRFLVLAGVFLGTAILMKQHGTAFFAFVFVCLAWELFVSRTGHWHPVVRPIASLVGGAVLPIAITALVVLALGNFDKFIFWTTEYATTYASGNGLERGWFNFARKASPLWHEARAIGLMAVIAPICLDWSHRGRTRSTMLCLFALFSFLAICPGLFFRPHYFIMLLPAVGLLAGASLDRCYRLLVESRQNALFRSVPALVAIAIVAITLLVNQDYLIHASPEQVVRKTYGLNPFSEALAIGTWLKENTEEDETIAVLGSEPQIYFYAKRKSATGYIYTYPLMEDQPMAKTMQEEMAREIETAAPRHVVWVHDVNSWAPTKKSVTHIFDWFNEFQANYRVVGWSEARPKGSHVYWGSPTTWPPTSASWIGVYERLDAPRQNRR